MSPRLKQPLVPHADVGERLRAARRRAGLTQVELAQAIGSHRSVVANIETGNSGLSVNLLRRLSRTLKISTDALLGEQPVTAAPIEDRQLLRRLQKAQGLSRRQKKALLRCIDEFLGRAQ